MSWRRLKKLLGELREEHPRSFATFAERDERHRAVLSWLERLPAGCELVGLEGFAEGRGLGETLPPDPVVFRTDAPRGVSFVWRTVFLNPDDLTKRER